MDSCPLHRTLADAWFLGPWVLRDTVSRHPAHGTAASFRTRQSGCGPRESLAPDNVSDALYDRQNSVYSPEASRERRTEIVEIKQGELPESEN